jgi:hypothetical protein
MAGSPPAMPIAADGACTGAVLGADSIGPVIKILILKALLEWRRCSLCQQSAPILVVRRWRFIASKPTLFQAVAQQREYHEISNRSLPMIIKVEIDLMVRTDLLIADDPKCAPQR